MADDSSLAEEKDTRGRPPHFAAKGTAVADGPSGTT
jgi:hypothetical protein